MLHKLPGNVACTKFIHFGQCCLRSQIPPPPQPDRKLNIGTALGIRFEDNFYELQQSFDQSAIGVIEAINQAKRRTTTPVIQHRRMKFIPILEMPVKTTLCYTQAPRQKFDTNPVNSLLGQQNQCGNGPRFRVKTTRRISYFLCSRCHTILLGRLNDSVA